MIPDALGPYEAFARPPAFFVYTVSPGSYAGNSAGPGAHAGKSTALTTAAAIGAGFLPAAARRHRP